MINKGIIATILPYKENYTYSGAQAAALWVSEFFKNQNSKILTIYTEIQIQKII